MTPTYPFVFSAAIQLRDGTTVDITDDVRYGDVISIERGRPDQAGQMDPGSCTMTLNNRDGKYSPRNPQSPYYQQFGRNTPMSVWVNEAEHHMVVDDDGWAAAQPSSAFDVTDLDYRVELSPEDIPQLGSDFHVMYTSVGGRWITTDGNRSWRLMVSLFGDLELAWSPDGTAAEFAWSLVPIPYPPDTRFAVRVTMDVDNGTGGHTIRFFTAPRLDGEWTQLGEDWVGGTTTAIYAASSVPLTVGGADQPTLRGKYHRAQLLDGIDGSPVASPVFSDWELTDTSVEDAQGNDWELDSTVISDRYVRFSGEISEWPQRWDVSGTDVYVPIVVSGPLRRYRQGSEPLQSTLRRYVPTAEPPPLVYWPMEDGATATETASGLSGGASLDLTDVTRAADAGFGGSAPLPTLGAAARMFGRVPGAAAGGWHAEFVYRLDQLSTTESTVFRLSLTGAGGGVAAVRFRESTAGIRVQALDEDNAVVAQFLSTNTDLLASFTGARNRAALFSFYNAGTNQTFVTLRFRNIGVGSWFVNTVFTGVPGAVTAVTGVWPASWEGAAIGHLGIWDVGGVAQTTAGVTAYNGTDSGFAGQRATNRIREMAFAERLPLTSTYLDTGEDTRLGSQGINTALGMIEDAEIADNGLFYELRHPHGQLHYAAGRTQFNRPGVLELDYGEGGESGEIAPPLEPTDDDQFTRNDVTITRVGGGFSRAVLDEGPMSTQAPPVGAGRYTEDLEINVFQDDQLPDYADWRLHLGTQDEMRFPTVRLNLSNSGMAAVRQRLLDRMDVGTRVRINNPPPWLPPESAELIVMGYAERCGEHDWEVVMNCVAARPWIVGEIAPEGGEAANGPLHVDTDGSELGVASDATQTELLVRTTDGPEWVETDGPTAEAEPGDLPVDVSVGGERVTVTAIQPAAWDLFDRTETDTWGTADDGHVWAESGGAASDRSVAVATGGRIVLTGDKTTFRVQALGVALEDCEVVVQITPDHDVTGGATIAGALLRAAGPADFYLSGIAFNFLGELVLIAYNRGSILATETTGLSYTAGTATWLRTRIDGQRIRARTWLDGDPEPDDWPLDHTVASDTIAAGTSGLSAVALGSNTNTNPAFDYSHSQVVRPQRFTVTRSVNSVQMSHPAGTDVRLSDPMIVSLM